MRVGIDVRTLETGHRFRGIGAYAKNLIKSISEIDHKNQYIFFTQQSHSNVSKIIKNKNFNYNDYLIRKTKDPTKYNWYLDQIYLPWSIKKSRVQLVHFLDQLSAPLIKTTKTIITIHDLIQITDPKQASWQNKIKIQAIKNAGKIITISQAVRKDITNYLGIKQNKIKVIYNGYDKNIFEPNDDNQNLLNFVNNFLKIKQTNFFFM